MSFNRYYILLLASIFINVTVNSQVGIGCTNADFESGNFTNWTGQTGNCCPIVTNTNGLVTAAMNALDGTGRHVIMSNGTDPKSCNQIQRVAAGGIYSARLGNSSTGRQAERLRYQFTIDPDNTLIIYKYAVILQDPGHSPADQPRFQAKLIDQNGNVIPCTFYEVAASGNAEGFQTCQIGSTAVRYKNWVTIGVDVSNYIGQTLTLDFATGDCEQSAHYGYAYVDAACAPFKIDSRYCVSQANQNSVTLSAPEGFNQYAWSTGQVGSSITIPNPVNGQVVSCSITSANGCLAVLNATLTPAPITPAFTTEGVCFGQPVNLTNNSTVQNANVASYAWSSSDGYTTNTTNFFRNFAAPGDYTVKLVVTSDMGCKDSITETVRVHAIPNAVIASQNGCLGDNTFLTNGSTVSDGANLNHTWIVNGDTIIGENPPFVFNQPDSVFFTLICTTDFGCTDQTSGGIFIYQNPIADFSFVERCFDLPISFTNTSTLNTQQNTFNWSMNGTTFATTQDANQLLSNVGNNEITLIVSDTYGNVTCDDTITLTVIGHAVPVVGVEVDTTICEDIDFTAANTSTIATGGSFNSVWSFGGNPISNDSILTYVFNDAGIYPITLTVSTEFGCTDSRTFDMYIYPTPEPPILSVSTPICPGDPAFFEAQAEANSSIIWNGPNSFLSNQFNFSIPLEIADMGDYSAFIVSQYGCISAPNVVTASIANIYGFDDFVFPNVITANNDGINDELSIQSYFQTCDKYKITIVNRWGNVVYIQDNNTTDFRGETEEGNELKEGVYFYKLEYESPLDKGVKHGFIHVVKN
jgi:gliding motility-associated-like protein